MQDTHASPTSDPKGRRDFLAVSGAAGAAALVGIANAREQNASGGTPATEIVAEFLRNTAEDKIQAAVQYLGQGRAAARPMRSRLPPRYRTSVKSDLRSRFPIDPIRS